MIVKENNPQSVEYVSSINVALITRSQKVDETGDAYTI